MIPSPYFHLDGGCATGQVKTITETDSTWLNSTADLQPIQGGDATYDARAILFKEVHSQQQNLRQVNPSYLMSSIRSNEFKIKPNPASTHVNIEYGLFEDEKAVVLIYDALGKQMLIENLDNNYTSQSLDVSQFKQGIYSLIIRLGGSNLTNHKLAIIK